MKIGATADTPTGDGCFTPLVVGTDDPDLACAEFITSDFAVWARNAVSPYAETLSDGEVPEQALAVAANSTAVGFVKLIRS